MKKLFFILILLLSPMVYGQEQISSVTLPYPTNVPPVQDPQLQNLTWSHSETENFDILSLDVEQGKYLAQNIEQMKTWVLTRWGLPDVKFSVRCRVCCVPNKELMEKIFRLDRSYGETIKDASGRIKASSLWLLLDTKPAESIPPALTTISLKEVEQNYNVKIGFWAQRGMSILNGTLPQIRSSLILVDSPLKANSEMFFSYGLFTFTEKTWLEQTKEMQRLFDAEAACLLLLLRKEFGQENFLKFVSTNGTEADFTNIYGFRNYSEFDSTFKRYMLNISNDIVQKKTPDDYLQVSKNQTNKDK